MQDRLAKLVSEGNNLLSFDKYREAINIQLERFTMNSSEKTKANHALQLLEQAWAYYMPMARPALIDANYEEVPLAA